MATVTITKGYNDPTGFTSGETVTPAKLNSAQSPTVMISDIVDSDVKSDAAISGSKLASGAIGPTQLATNAVETAKIADNAVTAAKLDGVSDIATKTANYTLVLEDAGRVIEFNSASDLILTVPANGSVAFATGATVIVTRRGAGEVTIAGDSGVTLRSDASKTKLRNQYTAAALIKIGSDEWILAGNLKA